MTKREAAIIMAYTGIRTLDPVDEMLYLYNYIAELTGRFPEPYTPPEVYLTDEIREKATNDFMKICKSATDEAVDDEADFIETDMTVQCPVCKIMYVKHAFAGLAPFRRKSKPNFCPNCGVKIKGD